MPEVENSVLARAKLPYVVHLFCPAPRSEALRAFLSKALNKRPDSRRLGFLSRAIDAPHVLLIGNGTVGPLMEYHRVHCTNITLTVMYVNPLGVDPCPSSRGCPVALSSAGCLTNLVAWWARDWHRVVDLLGGRARASLNRYSSSLKQKLKVLDFIKSGGPELTVGRTIFELWMGL